MFLPLFVQIGLKIDKNNRNQFELLFGLKTSNKMLPFPIFVILLILSPIPNIAKNSFFFFIWTLFGIYSIIFVSIKKKKKKKHLYTFYKPYNKPFTKLFIQMLQFVKWKQNIA